MKTIKRAYKFRLYPQDDLKVILAKTFGCARFVFNKSLDYSELNYKNKFLDKELNVINPEYKNISNIDRINYISHLKTEFTWLKEVSSIALQQSVKHLNNSYDRFFKKLGGFPQHKKNKIVILLLSLGKIHYILIKILIRINSSIFLNIIIL